MCFGQTNGALFFQRSLLTPTKVHAVPLQLTSARLRSSPTLPHVHVRGCGQERLPDLLSVCLQMFLYGSKGIASKMRTILYGRQLAVTWCTSRVDFGAGVNHSPACRARLPLHIGRSDQITRGLNVCSVRGCKGTQISSWMSWLARRSTGTGKGILEACFARGGGSAGQCCMLWAASARWSFVCCDKCAASCASDAIARQFCGASP
jgi:hypothetical protein